MAAVAAVVGQQQGSGYNTVFVGSKGYLGTSGRGEGVGLIPGSRWAEYQLPPRMLTRSPGHQRDWIRACKGGEPACSNFSVAGPYTEWMVLGAVADARRRQAALGREEDGVHQQQGSEQIREAGVQEGLGTEVDHVNSQLRLRVDKRSSTPRSHDAKQT